MKVYFVIDIVGSFYTIQTYLYKFLEEIYAGLFSIRKHILLLHEDTITTEEFLIGPSTIFI